MHAGLTSFRASHPPRTRTVRGAAWHYLAAGERGEPILFLHGLAGAADIWWQQITALEHRARVLAPTYPPVRRLDDLVAGVTAILDAEGVDAAHVVGSSLGGYLAQYLVATRPERVATAVFANTFPPNDLIRRRNRRRAAAGRLLPQRIVLAAIARDARAVTAPAEGRGRETVERYLLEQARSGLSKRDLLARYRCVTEPFDPPAPSLPTLIIESDRDPVVEPELRAQLRRTYPAARVVTLKGRGHFPYLSDPDRYLAHLDEFWARAATARTT